ncbi:MAG: hypothetical protein COA78_09460 [Blastopirellula sp.]|nr:MAG: hypothetical protein COA78_09460 [Blastopirellula sp.]
MELSSIYRHFSVNSTTFKLLPDNNVVIKTVIELQIIFINSFKRCLTQSRKGAKEGKKEGVLNTEARRNTEGWATKLIL